jgi:hypothetical protein
VVVIISSNGILEGGTSLLLNPRTRMVLLHEIDNGMKGCLALQGPDLGRNFATLSQKLNQQFIGF